MESLLEKIEELSKTVLEEGRKFSEKGVKAAGKRARVASGELGKVLKEFRKESLEASKE